MNILVITGLFRAFQGNITQSACHFLTRSDIQGGGAFYTGAALVNLETGDSQLLVDSIGERVTEMAWHPYGEHFLYLTASSNPRN